LKNGDPTVIKVHTNNASPTAIVSSNNWECPPLQNLNI
jgi:hypothetical protein